jgi:outer membrane lipoprotein LolB
LAAPVGALLLGACATAPPPPDAMAGRLAIRVEADGAQPTREFSAAFELRGDAGHGSLSLSTPIGTTLALARWSADGADLVTGDAVQRFDGLPALSRQLLGQELPLGALFDWLRARPWPAAPSVATAVGFEQLGWSVDLARHAAGWVLLQRSAPPAVSVRVRLDGNT